MSIVVEPKLHFRSLSEDAVLTALQDSDPDNPIAIEVARLVKGYSDNLQAHVKRLGYLPAQVLRIKPRWPIEAVAMKLTTETLQDAISAARN